jgi:hypothetical protein
MVTLRIYSFALAVLISLGFIAGCSTASHDRYIPPTDRARSAVEAALSSWKAGEPLKTITTHTPPVDFFDARRQAGKKLESFHIVGEVTSQEHPAFKVDLRFAGEKEHEETTYIVIGIDPLLVFRAEDFKKASGA